MDNAILLDKISKLPDSLKNQVVDFIDFLILKNKIIPVEGKPVFGSAKGMFIMRDDFGEPLGDFMEYM